MALHYYHKTSLGQMLLVNVGVCLRKYSLMKRCCQMVRAEAIAQMVSKDVRKKKYPFHPEHLCHHSSHPTSSFGSVLNDLRMFLI